MSIITITEAHGIISERIEGIDDLDILEKVLKLIGYDEYQVKGD